MKVKFKDLSIPLKVIVILSWLGAVSFILNLIFLFFNETTHSANFFP